MMGQWFRSLVALSLGIPAALLFFPNLATSQSVRESVVKASQFRQESVHPHLVFVYQAPSPDVNVQEVPPTTETGTSRPIAPPAEPSPPAATDDSPAVDGAGLRSSSFPNQRGTIVELLKKEREILKLRTPGIGKKELQDALLKSAYETMNRALDFNLEDVLKLPQDVKTEAGKLVDEVLNTTAEVPGETPKVDASPRIEQWVPQISQAVFDKNKELTQSVPDAAARSKPLVDFSLKITAQAADITGDDPAQLTPDERRFAETLAAGILRGDRPAEIPPSSGLSVEDRGVLFQQVRDENKRMSLLGIENELRRAKLKTFARERLVVALKLSGPEKLPSNEQVLADSIADQVFFDGTPGPGPDPETRITDQIRQSVLGLLRAINNALATLGYDVNTRRPTLLKFVQERFAKAVGASGPSQLSAADQRDAESLVDQILRETGTLTPNQNPIPGQILQPLLPTNFILVPSHQKCHIFKRF